MSTTIHWWKNNTELDGHLVLHSVIDNFCALVMREHTAAKSQAWLAILFAQAYHTQKSLTFMQKYCVNLFAAGFRRTQCLPACNHRLLSDW